MADLSQIFYSGLREQVRRVIGLLGEERTEAGLTAFVDGQSSWAHCFFARAVMPERLHDERDVARILGLRREDGSLNLVPVRIVYRTFDGASSMMSKQDLHDLIREIQRENTVIAKAGSSLEEAKRWLENKPTNTLFDFMKKIDYSGIENTPVKLGGPSCA